jgi:hypothetical protein
MRCMILVVALIASCPAVALATTWDEPWHEAVVKDADVFVKALVVKNEPRKLTLKVLKHLAGIDTPETVVVDSYSLLSIGSFTVGAHSETDFNLAENEDWYFFLKKVKGKETWALATPTAARAGISGENVIATYRHSYHQALVPEDLYVPSMTAIFQFLHGQKHDEAFVRGLFKTYLTQPPAEISGNDDKNSDLFFKQHAALESFYYFGNPQDFDLLQPFLKSNNFHVRVSAVRAVSRIDTAKSREQLWDILNDKGDGFARVMAVWGLKRLDAREYMPKLREFAKTAPEERTGFGGNIMDPRVGTRFPRSVKAACEELINEWNRPDPSAPPAKLDRN